jgi:DNA invertase Pin-like site-specific DNA recombinase
MNNSPTAALYARVSTDDQNCGMQLNELREYAQRMRWTAVEYVEKASGKAGSKRPQLESLLRDAKMRRFDVVAVWRMDRFGRSLHDLIENVRQLDAAGIRFIVPSQNIDTDQKTAFGRFAMNIFAAFAEFERDLIIDRVNAGLVEYKRAYAAGQVGSSRHSKSGKDLPIGRPRRVFRRDTAADMRRQGMSWRAISAQLGVPVRTLRRGVAKTGQ